MNDGSGDMNGQGGASAERWRHLVEAAFYLEEAVAQDEASVRAARTVVDSALEVFPGAIDPIDDFQGYAVRRLLLVLRRALPPESKAGPEPT